MSVDFSNNGATDWYEAAGAITLPDADWAVLFWVHLASPLSGSGFRYYLSNKGLNTPNSFNIFLNQGTQQVRANLFDATNPGTFAHGAGAVLAGTGSFLCAVQRRGTNIERLVCPKGGSATLATTVIAALGAISSPNLWNIGRRFDGNVDRYSKDIFGETAVILNDSLTQAQVEELARGRKTIFDLGFAPEVYWRLRHPDDLTDQSGNGHDLARNGAPKDSAITFIGPQPPDADNDGGARTIHVVDTRKRERAEEKGRRERQRFRKELRATVDRALRQAVDGEPPERTVERELTRRGFAPTVRDIAAMIAARRR